MSEQRSPEKDYFSRRVPSSTQQTPRPQRVPSETFRPRLASQLPASPTSPRTPRTPLLGRSYSSNFDSPGLSFRQDDDYLIFEFSHRYLRAGLGGEIEPRCFYRFDVVAQRRAGDYSQWIPDSTVSATRAADVNIDQWSKPYELWQMDLRNADLALVGDKVERALREAVRDHILVLDDSKKRKAILVIPPVMPHALLSTLCTKIFEVYPPPPSVILMSSPVMCTTAAGLRSALVVDIGWSLTTVSAVYEYREVKQAASTRAMKLLTWNMKNMLEAGYLPLSNQPGSAPNAVSFTDTEEVVQRMAWMRNNATRSIQTETSATIDIPLGSGPLTRSLEVPFEKFAEVTEKSFLRSTEDTMSNDDHELPLPNLMFESLLKLPVDIRPACLQRIIFDGGGAAIPGLKARVLNELRAIIEDRGWDPVENYGSAKAVPRPRTVRRPDGPVAKESIINLPSRHKNKDDDSDSIAPAHLQPPLQDPVLARIQGRAVAKSPREAASTSLAKEDEQGILHETDDLATGATNLGKVTQIEGLRSVHSLGAWAGASLLAGLRVSGQCEIERERFLANGLQSGSQTVEEKRKSTQQHQLRRQSLVGGLATSSSTAWNLGVWA